MEQEWALGKLTLAIKMGGTAASAWRLEWAGKLRRCSGDRAAPLVDSAAAAVCQKLDNSALLRPNRSRKQDELNLRAEFSVRRCNLVRYSHGGSMFAAVGRSHTILVHHAYSMQQLGLLKGHVSAVTALSFSPNDRMLVSSGAGGAIYFWDMNTLTKVSELEYVDKLSIYCNAMFLSR